MRVLISVGWLGGAGGAERAAYSMVRACASDQVDLVVRTRLDGPLAEVGPNVRISSPLDLRWWGSAHVDGTKGLVLQRLINPVRRRLLPTYDVYVQLFAGGYVAPTARVGTRLLVPSGNAIGPELARRYDKIALQAPDNRRFVDDGTPTVLLPPPLYDVASSAEQPTQELPERYFLTVFNPYGAIKGSDDLAAAAQTSPHPIVWCHSQQSQPLEIPAALRDHPRIIHVEDPTPQQLRYLYEHCRAYLAFSRTEGFGWSAADALRYSPAIATRPVGMFSDPRAWAPGTVRIGEEWSVDWDSLDAARVDPSVRDLAWLSPEHFRERLLTLAADRA